MIGYVSILHGAILHPLHNAYTEEGSDAALLKSAEVSSLTFAGARPGSECTWRFPQS